MDRWTDGKDRYEGIDPMDSYMFLLVFYDVSVSSTGLIPVRSFLSL